ncbi:hypothetical protein R1flu_010196 [Riccia fluitans]|uniref:Uncharacterized protein n=1 Tax=Riccia fluitans TaxID=41844 RepID=A0ABD1Z5E7_9MARC
MAIHLVEATRKPRSMSTISSSFTSPTSTTDADSSCQSSKGGVSQVQRSYYLLFPSALFFGETHLGSHLHASLDGTKKMDPPSD